MALLKPLAKPLAPAQTAIKPVAPLIQNTANMALAKSALGTASRQPSRQALGGAPATTTVGSAFGPLDRPVKKPPQGLGPDGVQQKGAPQTQEVLPTATNDTLGKAGVVPLAGLGRAGAGAAGARKFGTAQEVAPDPNILGPHQDHTDPAAPGAPGTPGTPPPSELDTLYNDMVNRAGEQWKITEDLNQRNMALMQRKSAAMQGAMGRSVAGGFAGAMGGAYIQGMEQLNQARGQHEQALNALQLSAMQNKQVQQNRAEDIARQTQWRGEDKAHQAQQEAGAAWGAMGPQQQAVAAQQQDPDIYAAAEAQRKKKDGGGTGPEADEYWDGLTPEERATRILETMMLDYNWSPE